LSENDPANKSPAAHHQPEIVDNSGFRVDRLSGLYLPSSYAQELNRKHESTPRCDNSPLPIRVHRGWWPIILELLTLAIGGATLGGVLYYAYWAQIQATASKNAADAAESAAKTAANQLEVSERPWVLATHEIYEALTFRPNGYATLILNQTLENSGQSTAVNIGSCPWGLMIRGRVPLLGKKNIAAIIGRQRVNRLMLSAGYCSLNINHLRLKLWPLHPPFWLKQKPPIQTVLLV
jgi:hypothetical protein